MGKPRSAVLMAKGNTQATRWPWSLGRSRAASSPQTLSLVHIPQTQSICLSHCHLKDSTPVAKMCCHIYPVRVYTRTVRSYRFKMCWLLLGAPGAPGPCCPARLLGFSGVLLASPLAAAKPEVPVLAPSPSGISQYFFITTKHHFIQTKRPNSHVYMPMCL